MIVTVRNDFPIPILLLNIGGVKSEYVVGVNGMSQVNTTLTPGDRLVAMCKSNEHGYQQLSREFTFSGSKNLDIGSITYQAAGTPWTMKGDISGIWIKNMSYVKISVYLNTTYIGSVSPYDVSYLGGGKSEIYINGNIKEGLKINNRIQLKIGNIFYGEYIITDPKITTVFVGDVSQIPLHPMIHDNARYTTDPRSIVIPHRRGVR